MYKISMFFMISLVFLSCADNTVKEDNKTKNYALAFKKKDSISSRATLRPLYFRSQYIWDENKLVHANGPDKLVTFNLDKNKVSNVITFEKKGKNNVNKANLNFYYHDKDSIFMLSNQKKFYLVNSNADIEDSFRLNSIVESNVDFGEPMLSMGSSNAIYKDNKIYFITYPNSPENLSNSLKDPVYVSLDIKSKTLTESNLKYAYSYEYDKVQHPFFIEPLSVMNEKGDYILLFKTNNEFIVTNGNKVKEKIKFQTKFFDDYSKMESKSQIPTFSIESNSNKKLLFDHERGHYYLFTSHYLDFKNSDTGKTNTSFSKPFSILVFDENFNKLLEKKFIGKKYNINMSFISNKGLHLSLNNPENDESFSDDYFKYETYKLNVNEIP